MLAYDTRNDYEIIGGEKVMAASPDMGHSTIVMNLSATVGAYVKINKLGICFGDHMDVHFLSSSARRMQNCSFKVKTIRFTACPTWSQKFFPALR